MKKYIKQNDGIITTVIIKEDDSLVIPEDFIETNKDVSVGKHKIVKGKIVKMSSKEIEDFRIIGLMFNKSKIDNK